MENQLMSIIMSRSSYRGLYEKKPVPKKDLELILSAGLAAPSGCNKQTASFIAVDDENLLKQINQVITPPICETAPAIICVLSQKIYAYGNKCYNVQDYSAAIQNMLLAINALGYESCWYEGHITDQEDGSEEENNGKKIANILGVPNHLELVCVLPVGHACEPVRKTKKKTFEEGAWFNGYQK